MADDEEDFFTRSNFFLPVYLRKSAVGLLPRRSRRRVATALDSHCQLDCLNGERKRRLVLLRVWPLGVRRLLSDEEYPESYAEQWSQKCA